MHKLTLTNSGGEVGIRSSHWKLIATISLIGAIIAGCVASLALVQYRATIVMQIGQIGNGIPMVNPNTLAEQINSPHFSESVISAMGLSPKDRRSQFIRETLYANVLSGSKLVQLRVDGVSRQAAMNAASTAVSLIQARHAALFDPEKARKNQLLDDYKRTRQSVEKIRKFTLAQLENAMARRAYADPHNVTLSSMAEVDTRELQALDDSIRKLSVELDPGGMFNTKPIASPNASSSIPAIRLAVCILLGLLMGGVLGVAALSMNDASFRTAFSTLLFDGQHPAVSGLENS